ncbi:hypothetical protein COO60DRAFT_627586 [Scenedesmus sp. NREL 46B-D3]|nr:hypothetical protein COO60DRAFT_627586 [Scenedesmus sp. NREL 46B-D3]
MEVWQLVISCRLACVNCTASPAKHHCTLQRAAAAGPYTAAEALLEAGYAGGQGGRASAARQSEQPAGGGPHLQRTPPGSVAAHAQAVWPVLPLVQLEFLEPHRELGLQAAVVRDLGAVQGLTSLSLRAEHICTQPRQLAAVLRRLPALQHLELYEYDRSWIWGEAAARGVNSNPAPRDFEAVGELLEAVGGLRQLSSMELRLAVELMPSEVQALKVQLRQLRRSELAACCRFKEEKLVLK